MIKKRGRPKGAEKTVIGLPRRKRFRGDQIRKPVSFLKKSPAHREEGLYIVFILSVRTYAAGVSMHVW